MPVIPVIYKKAIAVFFKKNAARLKCNTGFCAAIRLSIVVAIALMLFVLFMNWRFNQSLVQQYEMGFKAGKATEIHKSEQALAAMQKAYEASIASIESKHIKEMEALNVLRDDERKRIQHWNSYSGLGGNTTKCWNAKQLQELRESTKRTNQP